LEAPDLVSRASDRSFFVVNALVSSVALGVLFWLLVARHGSAGGGGPSSLPAINATLNATSALLLATGWVAIRRGARRAHAWLMVSAFVSSAVFLVCYLAYHYVHGDTRFGGQGAVRTVYLFILATHVVLSITVVPLALTAFWFAVRRAFVRHKRVTRFLLPIWLYVSVTGVVVYWMLYQLPH
jgi:putative membrane protein